MANVTEATRTHSIWKTLRQQSYSPLDDRKDHNRPVIDLEVARDGPRMWGPPCSRVVRAPEGVASGTGARLERVTIESTPATLSPGGRAGTGRPWCSISRVYGRVTIHCPPDTSVLVGPD